MMLMPQIVWKIKEYLKYLSLTVVSYGWKFSRKSGDILMQLYCTSLLFVSLFAHVLAV